MAVAPYEIIAGPAHVWVAPYGTAFPDVNAAPATPWTTGALGYTDGGITVTHNQNIEQLMVDQVPTPVKVMRTTEGLTVEFGIVQLTVQRYALILNNATVTDTAATVGPPATTKNTAFPLQQGVDVARFSMLVRGPSPYTATGNAQFEIPIVIQSGEPSVTYNRDAKSVLGTQWIALADTTKTFPNQFGTLRADSSA